MKRDDAAQVECSARWTPELLFLVPGFLDLRGSKRPLPRLRGLVAGRKTVLPGTDGGGGGDGGGGDDGNGAERLMLIIDRREEMVGAAWCGKAWQPFRCLGNGSAVHVWTRPHSRPSSDQYASQSNPAYHTHYYAT